MTGKVHQAIGVTTAFVVASKCPEIAKALGGSVYPILCAVAASPGSFLPDIDHQQSHYGRKVQVVSKHLTHRGPITHSLLIPVLVLLGYLFVLDPAVPRGIAARTARSVFYGFEVGYLAHLVADLFNGKGCPILWPLTKSHINIADVDSHGLPCIIFCIIWIGGLAAWYFLI